MESFVCFIFNTFDDLAELNSFNTKVQNVCIMCPGVTIIRSLSLFISYNLVSGVTKGTPQSRNSKLWKNLQLDLKIVIR